ncbi:hypothetical protein BDY17DRAFT_28825 [Neohortaea acidophila]|uniref:Uncharacterized protein n=1 Tax=Neohortaea acidophila TaxID=245834 RepID=A0A6A6PIU4_9PEZI|nr:uncharacterized protein BDY17DRAFT_28825 [Neohortaea acidophila]KAF2479939.1 hypothetical protein BDY17DRAFT_28825 [Neohortaea acidophila]
MEAITMANIRGSGARTIIARSAEKGMRAARPHGNHTAKPSRSYLVDIVPRGLTGLPGVGRGLRLQETVLLRMKWDIVLASSLTSGSRSEVKGTSQHPRLDDFHPVRDPDPGRKSLHTEVRGRADIFWTGTSFAAQPLLTLWSPLKCFLMG